MITRLICIFAIVFMTVACDEEKAMDAHPPIQNEPVQTDTRINDARILHYDVAEMAMSDAVRAVSRITSTSTFRSSNARIQDVSTPFTRIEVHNPSVKLRLTDEDGEHLVFDSTKHAVQDTFTFLRRSLPLPSIRRHHLTRWLLFNQTESSTWIGNITASWHNEDLRDFLTNGYWLRLEQDNAEVGTFVHGPELSETPELPTSGVVVYRGYSTGTYVSHYGPSWAPFDPRFVEGLIETGDSSGIVTLKVDFTNGTIEGCLGCVENNEITGSTIDPDGNRNEVYTPLSFSSIKLVPTSIQRGTFQGTQVTAYIGDERLGINFETLDNQGRWGGKITDRVIAGTVASQWAHADESRTVFVTSFFATKVLTQ
jgi:hypothetical protein